MPLVENVRLTIRHEPLWGGSFLVDLPHVFSEEPIGEDPAREWTTSL
jgi:hypothetical protein